MSSRWASRTFPLALKLQSNAFTSDGVPLWQSVEQIDTVIAHGIEPADGGKTTVSTGRNILGLIDIEIEITTVKTPFGFDTFDARIQGQFSQESGPIKRIEGPTVRLTAVGKFTLEFHESVKKWNSCAWIIAGGSNRNRVKTADVRISAWQIVGSLEQ